MLHHERATLRLLMQRTGIIYCIPVWAWHLLLLPLSVLPGCIGPLLFLLYLRTHPASHKLMDGDDRMTASLYPIMVASQMAPYSQLCALLMTRSQLWSKVVHYIGNRVLFQTRVSIRKMWCRTFDRQHFNLPALVA